MVVLTVQHYMDLVVLVEAVMVLVQPIIILELQTQVVVVVVLQTMEL